MLAFFSFCLFAPRAVVRGAFGAAFFLAARFNAFRSVLSSIFVVFAILSSCGLFPAHFLFQSSLKTKSSDPISPRNRRHRLPGLKLANRELGTVEGIRDGRLSLKMDGGRAVEFDPAAHPHLDHGYAVTSHSSQGQTAGRVLIHVDTQLGAKDLLNNRMAYVAVSRGAYDAQIFTDNREQLGAALGRNVSHKSALAPEKTPEMAIAPKIEVEREIWRGHGIGM